MPDSSLNERMDPFSIEKTARRTTAGRSSLIVAPRGSAKLAFPADIRACVTVFPGFRRRGGPGSGRSLDDFNPVAWLVVRDPA